MTVKNIDLLKEFGFEKVNHSNMLPIDLHYKEKFQKDCISLGLKDDHLVAFCTSHFKVANTPENIVRIGKINELMMELVKDPVFQEWIGNVPNK